MTAGWMKNLMKSLAVATFFAPFGMKPPPAPATAIMGVPSLRLGNPVTTASS